MASFGAVVVHVGPCIMGLLDGNQEMPTGEKCIVYKEFCFVWASISSSSNSTASPSKNKVEGEVVGQDPLGACVNY